MKLRSSRTGRLNKSELKRRGLSGNVHDIECPGEAHSNPYIDNCGLCAPRWEKLEVPAEHASIEDWRDWYHATSSGKPA